MEMDAVGKEGKERSACNDMWNLYGAVKYKKKKQIYNMW